MKAINNHYLVEIEKEAEDMVGRFFIDPAFKPEDHARIYGTVTAVPDKLTGPYKGMDQIIEVGDRVYFHYLVVNNDHAFDKIWKVEYRNILCFVRDGEIRPAWNWFMCQPVWDEVVEDIELPDGTSIKGVVGSSGLITKTNPQPSGIKAKVTHIEGHEDVETGDLVIVEPPFHFTNKIEGEDFYFSEKDYILAKCLKQ